MPTNQMPNPQILLTYRLATFFKVLGVMTAILTGTVTIWNFASPFYRWWSAGLSGLILLLLLAPWWKLFPAEDQPKIAHRLLILAIAFGIIGPNLELLTRSINPIKTYSPTLNLLKS